MKMILKYIVIGLIFINCTANRKVIIILKTLDQFDTQEENEQLGLDLISYMYPIFITQEIPDLSQKELDDIRYQYFIRESDKQVSFRLILSNEALAKKEKITNYFQETVDEEVDRLVNDKAIFDTAVIMTKTYLEMLDNYDFDSFWNNTSSILKSLTTKENFFSSNKNRESIKIDGGERYFHSKQYYKTMPNTDVTDIYVINYGFEKDENLMEQIVYIIEDNKLKITGYTNRFKN
ncbi:MAG: DUF4019 domain-containing protein [Bacteroidales bacterium]|nr:DUF4019 domain-containing protein [Bacteroidales bacterium]